MTEIAARHGRGRALSGPRSRGRLSSADTGWRCSTTDVRGAALQELAGSVGGACVVAGDIATRRSGASCSRIERELGGRPRGRARRRGLARRQAAPRGDRRRRLAHDDERKLETAHRSLRALLPPMVARAAGAASSSSGSRARRAAGDKRPRCGLRRVEGRRRRARPGGGGRGPRPWRTHQRDAPEHARYTRQSRRHAEGGSPADGSQLRPPPAASRFS